MRGSLQKKTFFCLELLLVLFFFLTSSSIGAQVIPEKVGKEKVEYTSQHLRAPFKSPFEELPVEKPAVKHSLSHLRVQGMVWTSLMPQAIINNTVLEIGEEIGGAKILDIRKEGVYLLYEGREYILRPTKQLNSI